MFQKIIRLLPLATMGLKSLSPFSSIALPRTGGALPVPDLRKEWQGNPSSGMKVEESPEFSQEMLEQIERDYPKWIFGSDQVDSSWNPVLNLSFGRCHYQLAGRGAVLAGPGHRPRVSYGDLGYEELAPVLRCFVRLAYERGVPSVRSFVDAQGSESLKALLRIEESAMVGNKPAKNSKRPRRNSKAK